MGCELEDDMEQDAETARAISDPGQPSKKEVRRDTCTVEKLVCSMCEDDNLQ